MIRSAWIFLIGFSLAVTCSALAQFGGTPARIHDASELTAGELSDARLSSNVPLKDQLNTFTASPISIEAIRSAYRWIESDAGLDEKIWEVVSNTDAFVFETVTDTGMFGEAFITGNRTGTNVDSLALQADSITLNGVASSDFSRLSQSNIFTGPVQTFSDQISVGNGGTIFPIKIISGATGDAGIAEIGFFDSDGVTQRGYIGDGSISDDDFFIEASTGDLQLIGLAITANSIDITPDSGSFTINWSTACTTTPTSTARWQRFGNIVQMELGTFSASCTGDSTSFSSSADIPAALRPAAGALIPAGDLATDNGANVSACVAVSSVGVFSLSKFTTAGCDNGSNWTAAGIRNLSNTTAIFTYNLGW